MTDKQFSLLMNEIKGLNGKFDGLSKEVKELKKNVQELNQRVDTLDKKVDVLDKRVDTLDKKVDVLDKRVDTLDKKVDALDKRVDTLDKKVDTLDKKTDAIAKKNDEHIGYTASEAIKLFGWQQKIEEQIKEFEARNQREHSELWNMIERRFDTAVRPIDTLQLSIEAVKDIALSNQNRILRLEKV